MEPSLLEEKKKIKRKIVLRQVLISWKAGLALAQA